MVRDKIKAGEYIYYEYDGGTIILVSSNDGKGCAPSFCVNKQGRFGRSGYSMKHAEIRYATDKERLHLDACIKANKYVPQPKSDQLNYEIY